MIDHTAVSQLEKDKIIDGLNAIVPGEAQTEAASLEERLAMGRQLSQEMSAASDRMGVLGIRKLQFSGSDVKAGDLASLATSYGQIAADLDKEESYQHKASKQEEAANRRGEYRGYRTDRASAAVATASLYKKYTDDPGHAPGILNRIIGDEFLLKPGETDAVIADRICNLMRLRDYEAKTLAAKKAGKLSECDEIYVRLREELIACMTDAIHTWFAANGVKENGGRAARLSVRNAKKHLPLALEKYEFMARTFNRRLAEEFMKTKTVTEHPDYVADKERYQKGDEVFAKKEKHAGGVGSGLSSDVKELEDFIADHPEEYQANKEKIDRLFAVYMKRLRKVYELDRDLGLANCSMQMKRMTGYCTQYDNGLMDLKQLSATQRDYYMLEAESARDYIKYLLAGEAVDVLHGVYIEKTWGGQVFNPIGGQDPHGPVAHNTAYARGLETRHADRLRELNGKAGTLQGSASEGTRQALDEAIIDMRGVSFANPVVKRTVLARADDRALLIRSMQIDMSRDAGLADIRSARGFMATGFSQIVNALVPFGQDPNLQMADLVKKARDLHSVMSGNTVVNGREKKVSDADLATALRGLIAAYQPRVGDLKTFMNANPGLLAPRSMLTLFNNSDQLSEFAYKAVALRDVMDILFRSPAFDLLQPSEQDAFRTEYASLLAMCNVADELQKRQLATMNTWTVDEMLERRTEIVNPSYDEALQQATAELNEEFSGRQRVFRHF